MHPSASELHVLLGGIVEPDYGDVSMGTCNSYLRSRHMEADAQVTLKALLPSALVRGLSFYVCMCVCMYVCLPHIGFLITGTCEAGDHSSL